MHQDHFTWSNMALLILITHRPITETPLKPTSKYNPGLLHQSVGMAIEFWSYSPGQINKKIKNEKYKYCTVYGHPILSIRHWGPMICSCLRGLEPAISAHRDHIMVTIEMAHKKRIELLREERGFREGKRES